MPTKVIDNNEARIPFLGDKISFITGLDPLGLQNPSSQAYSYLLPGLNNVTGRIRYYSFYCWLLREYAKIIESTDPKQQRQFIRRAEYIVALITAKAKLPSVPGIAYATLRLNESISQFDLQQGTYNEDESTEKTYWQFHWGIFGQYYVGALRQIGLIEEPVSEENEPLGIYRVSAAIEGRKVTGQDLSSAFDTNISPLSKKIFLNSIEKGSISKKDLEKLATDFNLTELESANPEGKLLLTLLMDIDEPAFKNEKPVKMRKDTMRHLLEFSRDINGPFNAYDFTKHAYNVKGKYNAQKNLSLMGWYYYQLNEYWQFACTAILNGCLDLIEELAGTSEVSLPLFISQTTEFVVVFLEKQKLLRAVSKSDSLVIKISEEELYESIIDNITTKRIAYSLLLIWKLNEENRNYFRELFEYTKERGIGESDDVLSFYLSNDGWGDKNVSAFVHDFLAEYIIYRHQIVAYRKMGMGSQSTQKFIIENNYIRKIGNFDPAFTGPRIGNLIQFLKDLQILNVSNQLTKSGMKLIEQLNDD